ncbi:MAG: SDR family oxidoreductase [Polyangiaceae bacterium]
MRVIVTGASRGIGLELCRQLAGRGDQVVAGARRPAEASELRRVAGEVAGRITVLPLDVASEESVRSFGGLLTQPVDVLINNAGVVGKMGAFPELDFTDLQATYGTNALGPLRVASAALAALRQGDAKKIVNVSTGMASLADNTSGGAWGYRMAKAALNMATRNLALALGKEGFVCVAVNPGWVKTDMGGAGATMAVEESAARILRIVDTLDATKNGSFLNHDGNAFPW